VSILIEEGMLRFIRPVDYGRERLTTEVY
jgi:hypothetical protein